MNPECWRLEGHTARLHLPGLSLAFDADRPAEGLSIAVADGASPGGSLFGIASTVRSAASTSLVDWYVLFDDLIAVYETGQPDAARVDLLWHAAWPTAADPWFARIDLLVSVRTDRLDWRHDISVDSVLPTVTLAETFACASLFKSSSLALMVHPADLGRQELTTGEEASAACRLRQHLFRTEYLEKGVILRARARAWFLPAEVDSGALAACIAEFTAADPPLT